MKQWTLKKSILALMAGCAMVLLCLGALVGCDEPTEHKHAWQDWLVEIQPTCTAKGAQERVCADCGEKEQSFIAELGHDTVAHAAKEATCTEAGYEAYEACKRCDYTTYVEKAALGHDTEAHDAKEPTCTETGYDAYETCGRCDHTTYAEKAALGHELTQHAAKEPTCTEAGYYAYETCGRCDHTTYKVWEPFGHLYQKGECQYCGDKDESFRDETIIPVDENLMPVHKDSVNLFGYVKTVVDAWGNYLFYGVYLPDRQNTASLELTYGPYGPLSMEMYEMDELMYKCVMTYDERGSILSMTVTAGEESVTYQFASKYDAAGLLVSQVLTVPEYDASLEIKYEHLEDGTWKATYEDGAYGVSYVCKGWFHVLKATSWSNRYYREEIGGIMPPVLSYFVQDYWLTTLYIRYTSDGEISYKEETTYNERHQELSVIRKDAAGNLIQKSEYQYDENGNRKKYTIYDANGNVKEWVAYNENGEMTKYARFYDRNDDGIYEEYSEGFGYQHENWTEYMETLRIVYDENGDVLRQDTYNYEFDENGTLRQMVAIDQDGNIFRVIGYNEDGEIILSVSWYDWDDDGVYDSYIEYRYDENGNKILRIETDAEGNILAYERYEYEYYGDGSVKTETAYDQNGLAVEMYEYNEDGDIIVSANWYDWDDDGVYDSYTEYRYDENGNCIVWIRKDAEGNILNYKRYEYEYYDDGTIKTETAYDQNGLAVEMHEYNEDGDTILSVYWYDWDDDGQNDSCEEWYYDENHNVILYIEKDGEGNILVYKRYESEYYADGTIKKEMVYDRNGIMVEAYEYDENGDTMFSYEWHDWDEDGVYEEYVEYTYWEIEDGWRMGFLTYGLEYDGNGNLLYIWEFSYDRQGNCIYQVQKDADGNIIYEWYL